MWQLIYFYILIFCSLLEDIIHGYHLEAGTRCPPLDGDIYDGICKYAMECDAVLSALRETSTHPYARCRWEGFREIVCCPIENTDTSSIIDKYNTAPKSDLRVAERECEKIKNVALPPLGNHITGGQAAGDGEFPHMVALGYPVNKSDSNSTYLFKCGGSLISETFVLTARHCVYNLDRLVPTIVRIGVVNIKNKHFDVSTDVKIEDIVKYPVPTDGQKYNDIILLRLEAQVSISKAICLYTSEENPTIPLTVTGWGATNSAGTNLSTVLQKANLDLVPNSICREKHKDNLFRMKNGIIDTQLCASDSNQLKDSCKGDSGGPLQGMTSNDGFYRLVGITSTGQGCANSLPGIYTRVASYLDWIESVVWPGS